MTACCHTCDSVRGVVSEARRGGASFCLFHLVAPAAPSLPAAVPGLVLMLVLVLPAAAPGLVLVLALVLALMA